MEFMAQFPDDAACLNHLWRTRYSADGEHAPCPKCKVERTFKRYANGDGRPAWTCTTCGLHVHPTAGTIFHKSSTSLHLWFYALFLITSTRCGISAKQLERELGVTYKTAWRMFNVIRNSLMAEPAITPLSGTVEADETYFNRSRRNRPNEPKRRSGAGPVIGERTVFGMVERQGRVIVRFVPDATANTLSREIDMHILPASMVYTDMHRSYDRTGKRYGHQRVNHSAMVWVDGDVHTQTIEGFWSLVKRGINGVYHSVSAKWLQSYLDEYAWRYNHQEFTRRQTGVKRVPNGEAKFRLLLDRACRPIA
ncbi:MAG: IS1595 family transposase [Candidatus Dormibacteraeota bacterium]|uniref:IS1595 family transposase n=1 Tax=Candidatus Aeolococcus gillhamiae TaxID=3127015 RepID=A0A934K087_9BACT|nr:IS1595 family transposase [Candidatus Dormibacteraeota bacterium]